MMTINVLNGNKQVTSRLQFGLFFAEIITK